MEMVKDAKLQIIQEFFNQLESNNYKNGCVLSPDLHLLLWGKGLLHPHVGGTETIEEIEEQVAELRRLGQVAVLVKFDDGYETYTLDIAALRKEIERLEKLDGKQTVSSDDKRPEEQKPQEQEQSWQGYIAPKYEDTVLVAVRVEPDIRDKFHAVMRAKNTTAQEFLSAFIVQEVKKHPELVERGEHMEAEGTKKNYRTKLRILKEENARLRAAAHTGKSNRSL